MARRKNVKRIDPRYFLHETVDRGEELEEEIGRLDRADEPPGGWPTSRGPRKRALGDPVPGGEEDEEDRDLLALQHDATEEQEAWRDSIEEGCPHAEEDEEELEEIVSDEDMEKAGLQSAGWEPEGGEEALAKRSGALEKAGLQSAGWEPEGGKEALSWRDKLRGKK